MCNGSSPLCVLIAVDFEREPTGGVRSKGHLRHRARPDAFFNIVAVPMQGHCAIGAEAQRDRVPFLNFDRAHALWQLPKFDRKIKYDLGSVAEPRAGGHGKDGHDQRAQNEGGPHGPELDWTSEARLSIQPASYGAGITAGSLRADQTSRPKRSENPATGFHAASGLPSMPSASQPFHGKSLSFTVRRNIGELSPVSAS